MPVDAATMEPDARPRFRPSVPRPLREQPGLFAFLKAVRANPITTWLDEHFVEPVVAREGGDGPRDPWSVTLP